MSHYLDIHLRPDPELPPHHLLSALYARLHRALAQMSNQDLGVSFPGHDQNKPSLGTHLRLHGPAASLHLLMKIPWLNGMRDHLKVGEIAAVPTKVKHRIVQRVQAKSSPARLRRRAVRRHYLDAETVAQRIPDSAAERLRMPFVTLGSRTTKQPSFPLFIRHGPLLSRPEPGIFNSYGLSAKATIPWF
ncbi:MAG: type I-F CRISPR-associated endoribonuclease Cas6/Csy4 [Rhodanobacteraceae bacterium]